MAEYRRMSIGDGLVIQREEVRRMSIDNNVMGSIPIPPTNVNNSYHVYNTANNFNIRTITSTTAGPSTQTRSFSFIMPSYSFLLPVSQQPQVNIQESGYPSSVVSNSQDRLRPEDMAQLVKLKALEAMPRYIWVLDSLLQTDTWEDRDKAVGIREQSIQSLKLFIENGPPEEVLPVVQSLNNLYNSESGIQLN